MERILRLKRLSKWYGDLQVLLLDATRPLRWAETRVTADDGQRVPLAGKPPVFLERAVRE